MGKGFLLTLQAGALGLVLLVLVAAVFVAGAYGLLYLARRAEQRLPLEKAPAAGAAEWTAEDVFYAVSGRGRAAYLLLCLERALAFYGQDLTLWQSLLERYWAITAAEEDAAVDWLETVFYLLPDSVLPYECFEDASEAAGYPWSAAQFEEARRCYTAAGWGMIVFNTLLQNLYLLVSGWDEEGAPTPEGLRLIAEAENQMRVFRVPLPQEGPALAFVKAQKGKGPGAPFDGLALSVLGAEKASDAAAEDTGKDAAVPVFTPAAAEAKDGPGTSDL